MRPLLRLQRAIEVVEIAGDLFDAHGLELLRPGIEHRRRLLAVLLRDFWIAGRWIAGADEPEVFAVVGEVSLKGMVDAKTIQRRGAHRKLVVARGGERLIG